MRLARGIGLALALAATVAASALAADGGAGAELVDAGGSFPARNYVISTPKQTRLTAADVTVTENGRPVEGATVVPANSEGGVGTVLLIDASNSMRTVIDEAMASARSFARATRGQAISVVTFNAQPTVQLPFTFEQREIDQALARAPALDEGTRIYDALAAAQAQIRDARLGGGRIVLISDGADVGSTIARDTALDALTNEKVRVYTVGIDSPDFSREDMETIAAETGASFAQAAKPAALKGIFTDLGVKASNEYVLRYTSDARPGKDVDVRVVVKGVAAPLETSYTSPRPGQGSPYEQSLWNDIVQGWPLMLVVAGLMLALVVYAVRQLAQLRTNRKLRSRLSEYTDLEREAALRREEVQALFGVSVDAPASRLRESDWFKRFELEVEIARIAMPAQTLLLIGAGVGIVLGLVLAALVSPFLFLAAALPPFLVWTEVTRRASKTRRAFQEQLDDNLEVLASGLRAGHTLAGAMNRVVEEAAEPSRSEFRRVVTDERLGVPLDQALEVTAARMRSSDIDQVALLALIQREAGGNMAEVLDQVIINIRAREEVRRLVRVLTAQGRLSRWVITGVPIALFVFILLFNPDQLDPLFHDPIGQVSLVVAVIGLFTGSYFIKRIVDIEL
jgi:tight adherence protein B